MITPLRRGIVCAGYSNHIGSCKDAWDNMYGVFTRNDPGAHPEVIIRRRQHGTGLMSTIAHFPATATAKYGYCTLECVGAHLVLWLSERQPDGTNPDVEYILPNAVTEFAPATLVKDEP